MNDVVEDFFEQVDREAAPLKPNRQAVQPRFKLTRFNDIQLGTDRAYLVKGLIPKDGLIVIWGPPKCGKTFWCFDLMMHVALGREYRGRRVEGSAVVYIACEGERGLAARAAAFRQTRMAPGDDPLFHLLTTRLDLVNDVDVSPMLWGACRLKRLRSRSRWLASLPTSSWCRASPWARRASCICSISAWHCWSQCSASECACESVSGFQNRVLINMTNKNCYFVLNHEVCA